MERKLDLEALARMSDHDLVAEVTARAMSERRAMAELIAALAELNARRLYLGRGYASLFAYCTQARHPTPSPVNPV